MSDPTQQGGQVAAQYIQPFGNTPGSTQMNKYLFVIWLVVLGTLVAVMLVFGILAYLSRDNAATAAWLMAPVTTALGAFVGLLSPNPK